MKREGYWITFRDLQTELMLPGEHIISVNVDHSRRVLNIQVHEDVSHDTEDGNETSTYHIQPPWTTLPYDRDPGD